MIITPLLLAADCSGQSLLPNIYRGVQDPATCEVKLNKLNDILILVANGIEIALTIAVFVAVGFIIFGGFRYIISSGDPSGVKKAKETIVNAIIGLVLAMVSFGIVRFITGSF